MVLRKYNETGSINNTERWISAVAGGTLAFYAVRNLTNKKRRSWKGYSSAVGAGLMIMRSITGKSPAYRLFGINTKNRNLPPSASIEHGKNIQIEHTILIRKAPEELFRFWRNFENLPQFMEHLQEVRNLDANKSHWVVKGPAGSTVEWDAVIHNEIPNRLIAWRTVENADINHAGSVEFEPGTDPKSTEVKVKFDYEPPAGRVGEKLAQLFGEEPGQQIEQDMQRLKDLLESNAAAESLEETRSKDTKLFEDFLK